MAGGAWDKNDSHAATTMLPSLLMVYDVSQDSKWLDYYNQFLPGQIRIHKRTPLTSISRCINCLPLNNE